MQHVTACAINNQPRGIVRAATGRAAQFLGADPQPSLIPMAPASASPGVIVRIYCCCHTALLCPTFKLFNVSSDQCPKHDHATKCLASVCAYVALQQSTCHTNHCLPALVAGSLAKAPADAFALAFERRELLEDPEGALQMSALPYSNRSA